MTRPKPHPQKRLIARTHTLTKENDQTLRQLSQEAADVIGWTVSSSAVVRALLRYVREQPSAWVSTMLFPIIEEEIQTGMVWGCKKTRE